MNEQNDKAAPAMKPPNSGVAVRMYNAGFGDCFLLAFRAEDGEGRYMLIDCGVHHQYPDGDSRMQRIAKDIAESTANHLHVVVVSHEHTDHLYGFRYAKDIFDNIRIDDLWLAWTEDPSDVLAQGLRQLHQRRVEALTAAIHRLSPRNKGLCNSLGSLLEFEPLNMAATGGSSAELDYLRQKSLNPPRISEDYCTPGEAARTMPGVKGVRFYVLGPPRDIGLLKKLQKKSELYPEFAAVDALEAFSAALRASPGADLDEDRSFRRSCPFDTSLGIPWSAAASRPFFREFYGFTEDKTQGVSWRRIDDDWLDTAGELALRLDTMTNNTSLVLAIELTDAKPSKVLLFAADAQVGNWLSWHALRWTGKGGNEVVTGTNLLKRTVFYKVGHHGSRNATLRQNGLEMMPDSDLIAMIPVDEEWAKNEMHWEHPAEKLLARLEEKTKGRVIRSDRISPEASGVGVGTDHPGFPERLDWDRGPDKLWIQYVIGD